MRTAHRIAPRLSLAVAAALLGGAGLGAGGVVGSFLSTAPADPAFEAAAAGDPPATGQIARGAVAADASGDELGAARVHSATGRPNASGGGAGSEWADPEEPGWGVHVLKLALVERRPESILAEVRGIDRAAPRELALHWVDAARHRAALLARSASGPDGRFVFERVLLPQGAHRLVAAPRGADPFGRLASLPRAVVARDPAPPVASVLPGEDVATAQIAARLPAGTTLWLSPAQGLDPVAVAGDPRAARRVVALLPRDASGFVVSLERADGERSAWSFATSAVPTWESTPPEESP